MLFGTKEGWTKAVEKLQTILAIETKNAEILAYQRLEEMEAKLDAQH